MTDIDLALNTEVEGEDNDDRDSTEAMEVIRDKTILTMKEVQRSIHFRLKQDQREKRII